MTFVMKQKVGLAIMANEKRYAVLIDADNISDKYIQIMMDEVSNFGVATYKRIYGDWTSTGLNSWKQCLLQHSITPIQQYAYTTGKNSTDSAMIIDAMDILYTGKVDGFCIASSDSDFTRLAARLRESGMDVVGMGESKTPKSFVSACNQFKYLDVLLGNQKPSAAIKGNRKAAAAKPNDITDITAIQEAVESIVSEASDEDGWIFLGSLGAILRKRHPDFDVRNYGYYKLNALVADIGAFDMKSVVGPTGAQAVYVRRKEQLDGQSSNSGS